MEEMILVVTDALENEERGPVSYWGPDGEKGVKRGEKELQNNTSCSLGLPGTGNLVSLASSGTINLKVFQNWSTKKNYLLVITICFWGALGPGDLDYGKKQ